MRSIDRMTNFVIFMGSILSVVVVTNVFFD